MKYFLSIFALILGSACAAQIVNGNFETSLSIPSTVGQFYLADGWSNAGSGTSTPDYYHYFGGTGGDIPETPAAIVNSWDGNAIMGMVACGLDHTNYREYISNEFSAPLTVGKRYLVSFYVTNGEITPLSSAGLGTSNLGVCFSQNQLTQYQNEPIHENPQFAIDTVLYSKDWEHIEFVFVADQAYEHMTVGVFGDDSVKEVEMVEGAPEFGYYFFDGFRIMEVENELDLSEAYDAHLIKDPGESGVTLDDSEYPEFFIPNAFTPNGDGENDLFKPVSAVLDDFEYEIFSRWGDKMYAADGSDEGWNGKVQGKVVEAGVYVWRITYIEGSSENPALEKQLQGTVNLVR